MDPEARPSIAQLLQALGAVANGKPLPYYVIPAEAIERRKEREITAKKREEKNKILLLKKKPVKIVPFKPTGPLDCNSVAARRLAMKKGGNNNMDPNSAVDVNFSSEQSIECETIFDTDFSNNTYSNDLSSSSPIKTKTDIHNKNSENLNTTFGTSDPWDSSIEFSTITESKNKNNISMTNLFEAFHDDSYISQQPPSYSSTISPFKTSNYDSGSGSGSSSTLYSNSPPRYSPPKSNPATATASAAAATDLFEWSDTEVVSDKSNSPQVLKRNPVNQTVFGVSHSNSNNSIDAGHQTFTSSPKRTTQESIHGNESNLFDFDFSSSSSQQSQPLTQSQSFSEFDFSSTNHENNNIIDFFGTGPPISLPLSSHSPSPPRLSLIPDSIGPGSLFVQSTPILTPSSAPPVKPMKPLPSTQSKVTRPFSTSNIPRQPSIPIHPSTVGNRVVSQRLNPTYEVDLFDTTPGPPEIDFLSLENPDFYSSKPSVVFARQQATDVLALFDSGPADGSSLPTTPRPTYPDLTKGQGLGQGRGLGPGLGQGLGQGLGYSPRSQQQPQQQQQQQRGFGAGISLG